MSLGSLLHAKRTAFGMTLQEVAEASGTSMGYVHALEKDKSEPGILLCAKLSVALGVSVQAMAAAALTSALKETP